MKPKTLKALFILLIFSLFFISISCKNESEQYELNPDLFPKSEDTSDETDENESQASGRLMSVNSDSEGIKVHLNYNKRSFPYFKLFLINEKTNKKIYYSYNSSQEQTDDIVFFPVSQNNTYSVNLWLYMTEENFKENTLDHHETIGSIEAFGGIGEFTFTPPSYTSRASYNNTNKTLTFSTASSNNQLYDFQQTFDLYIYTLTPMPPQNGQDNLTAQTILEKYSNPKILTATDNTYDVSQILQDYCVANQKDSVQFGLLEKLQFRKAGETNYLYEVIYNDTVFAHHEPYTYTKQ